MKKIAVILALLSFTFALNATITKEDIYNANPTQFEELKKELASLNKEQSEQLKKVYLEKELQKAFKTIFSDKNILQKYNYAVIENGKIVKLSDRDNEDGVLFWHEHSPALENPLPDNYCLINEPSWENTNLDSPCGVLKYQMTAQSPYNQFTNWHAPIVYLLIRDSDAYMANVDEYYNSHDTFSMGFCDTLASQSYHFYVDIQDPNPQRLIDLLNNQVVTDVVASSGYTYTPEGTQMLYMVKPYSPQMLLMPLGSSVLDHGYSITEFLSPTNETLYSLKTGNYIQALILRRPLGEEWWEVFQIVLKWFNIDVKNAYLDGDVGIEENNKTPLAQINWDNKQITINLEDSVNPETTTYTIYGVNGKLIKKGKLHSQTTTLNMPFVASGVYVIKVQGKDFSVNKKISFVK